MSVTTQEFIDAEPTSGKQRLVVFILFLVMLMEGMNEIGVAQLWGTLATPVAAGGWGVSFEAITVIVTLGTIAIAVGAVVAGTLADRIGRKNTLFTGLIVFMVFAAALSFAPNVVSFGVLRILSCVGLGAVFVTALAFVGDLTRHTSRARLTTVVAAGAGTGGVVAAVLSAALLEDVGWRNILLIVALLPIVVFPLVALIVPESPGLLVLRAKSPDKVRKALHGLLPSRDISGVDLVTVVRSEEEAVNPVKTLFTRGLASRTIVLWVLFIAFYATLNFVLQYLPVLLEHPAPAGPGFSAEDASIVFAVMAMGGVLGALVISVAVGKINPFVVIGVSWSLALVLLVIIVLVPASIDLYLVLFGLFGAALIGGTAAAGTLPVLTYPLSARGTGTGAATGVGGGFGTTVGGFAGGALIATGIGTSAILLVVLAPVGLGVVLVTVLGALTARHVRGSSTPVSDKVTVGG
ncbi:MAG TPA: MFS transporter [Pseudolysinimonas sp.]|nr:MFS transporter [Pseudolysinimonas sp.]